MRTMCEVAITGIGTELPGATTAVIAELHPEHLRPEAFDPRVRVGRKGVRFKDHATLMAMSASLDALRDAGLPEAPEAQLDAPGFGVVVSCNLGNLDTVVNVIRVIRAEHVDAASAMDLPNASSNVVASSLAIRHGLQGPNLMLCNGATSSLDALHLAANCIRAGRAQRMLVVGVEVDNEVVRALPAAALRWFNGAVAVVLESANAAQSRGARICGKLGHYGFAAQGDGRAKVVPVDTIDVTRHVGESYGAEGLVQLIALLQSTVTNPQRAVLACGHKFGDHVAATLEVELSA